MQLGFLLCRQQAVCDDARQFLWQLALESCQPTRNLILKVVSMKLLIYSHDAFGLGNIRRMLAICQHLLLDNSNLSILVLSGSPALHSLRLPPGLDYIKLPCVSRNTQGSLGVRFLGQSLAATMQLRSQLIRAAIANFQPDLFLVDKKPLGLERELEPALAELKRTRPHCKLVLLLRDILDAPEATIATWQKKDYYRTIADWYDCVWVVGTPAIFDVRQEYQFPTAVARKVRFCGYVRRGTGALSEAAVRSQLGLSAAERLVLVTAGGGGDGERLIETYLAGLSASERCDPTLRHVVVCGPEMPAPKRQRLGQAARSCPQLQMLEFVPDLDSYANVADVVVAMGGYNTICEILSLRKRAVVVPRDRPVREQLIRAQRMGALGAFAWIHPADLTSAGLMEAVCRQLEGPLPDVGAIDLDGLPRIGRYVRQLLAAVPEPSEDEAALNLLDFCDPLAAFAPVVPAS